MLSLVLYTTYISCVGTSLNILSKFLIGAAAFVYFLIDMDKIRNGIRNFFKKRTIKTFNYVKELDNQMRRYLSGLLKVMLISIVEYTLAYTLIGHPNALLLGFLAGVANLIPYFGGMANNTLAAITAFVVSPTLFIKTIITFIVLSMIDSYDINANKYFNDRNEEDIKKHYKRLDEEYRGLVKKYILKK